MADAAPAARSILITGACGDIGAALAAEFAATTADAGLRADAAGRTAPRNADAAPRDVSPNPNATANLALCDLLPPQQAEERLRPLFHRPGVAVHYRQVDVTDADAVATFVGDAAARFDGIDVCIGNAGIVERGRLIDLSADAWRRTLDVNLTGCFLVAQAAARVMKERSRGGHIVVMSSWTQDVPRDGIGAYCTSKSGLKMLAKCLALELGPAGIRVNLVAPGFVDAGLTGQNLRKNPGLRPGMEASIPLGRLISAEALARTVRMICSDDASYLTGATITVDGGSSLFYRRQD